MNIKRTREIAERIVEHRKYLTFDNYNPLIHELLLGRGPIPHQWWNNQSWMNMHMVMPVLRQRLRYPVEAVYRMNGFLPMKVDFVMSQLEPRYFAFLQELADSKEGALSENQRKERQLIHFTLRNSRLKRKMSLM